MQEQQQLQHAAFVCLLTSPVVTVLNELEFGLTLNFAHLSVDQKKMEK